MVGTKQDLSSLHGWATQIKPECHSIFSSATMAIWNCYDLSAKEFIVPSWQIVATGKKSNNRVIRFESLCSIFFWGGGRIG